MKRDVVNGSLPTNYAKVLIRICLSKGNSKLLIGINEEWSVLRRNLVKYLGVCLISLTTMFTVFISDN